MQRTALSRLELAGMHAPRLLRFVPRALRTGFTVDGRPVFFVHNPKAAGSSLKALLDCAPGRTLHIWSRGAFTRSTWRRSVVVCAVRDPLDRFLSGYDFHVRGPYRGALFRLHGEALKALSVEGYFDLIRQYPDYLGPQSLWYAYPDAHKPMADVILRTETPERWAGQLAEAGIDVSGRDIPVRNASGRETRVDALDPAFRRRVQDFFAEDYERLGYDRV